MVLSAKWRKVVYWATLGITALSAIFMGVGAALGVVDADAVAKGASVAATILGILTPILALLNIKPDVE